MLQSSTIQFLKSLKKNNNREWFEKNRKLYEAAKEDFRILVDRVIEDFGRKDTTIASLNAKNCVFRINRDIRFSKDKSPYKSNMGASINKGGKKAMQAGYYFHCEPGDSFVGGGLWIPEKEELKKVRQEIDYNFEGFKKIIQSKKFVNTYKDLDKSPESSLSREPKGYEKDNPAIEYIKLKSWIAMRPLTDEDLLSKDLTKKITTAFETLHPLILFLNEAIEN